MKILIIGNGHYIKCTNKLKNQNIKTKKINKDLDSKIINIINNMDKYDLINLFFSNDEIKEFTSDLKKVSKKFNLENFKSNIFLIFGDEKYKSEIINILSTKYSNFEDNIWKLFEYFSIKIVSLFFLENSIKISSLEIESIFDEIYSKFIVNFEQNFIFNLKNHISKNSYQYEMILFLIFLSKLFISYLYKFAIKNHLIFNDDYKWNSNTLIYDNKIEQYLDNGYLIYTTNYTNVMETDKNKIIHLHGDNYLTMLFGRDIKDKCFLRNINTFISTIIELKTLGTSISDISIEPLKKRMKVNIIYYELDVIKDTINSETIFFGISTYGDQYLLDFLFKRSKKLIIYYYIDDLYSRYNWENKKRYYDIRNNNVMLLVDSFKF